MGVCGEGGQMDMRDVEVQGVLMVWRVQRCKGIRGVRGWGVLGSRRLLAYGGIVVAVWGCRE